MIRWTGRAPWVFEFPVPGSLTSTFLFQEEAAEADEYKEWQKGDEGTLYSHTPLHTTHYTLHTTHYTLHTTHYKLHTTPSTAEADEYKEGQKGDEGTLYTPSPSSSSVYEP